jgi:3-oxoacyl-(acyl-carrier-protein) synthase
MSASLAIIGYGTVTAVGFGAAQTCAAIRAGLAGFRSCGFWLPRRRFTPLTGASVPYDVPAWAEPPPDRLARMAGDAVSECLREAGLDPDETPILLGVRQRPGGATARSPYESSLLQSLAARLGGTPHPDSALLSDGRCTIATALIAASRLLETGRVGACIVGGVDSFLTYEDIERDDRLARLKNPDNSRGFIPGEAAAVVAVTASPGPGRTPRILAVGLGREDPGRSANGDGYPTGRGMRAALAAAASAAGLEDRDFSFRVVDLNGEAYGAQDSILGAHRFYRHPRPAIPAVLPAASVGETGAAAGALGVLVAAVAMVEGYAPGRVAMCEAASEGGLRSAVVVCAPP